MMPGWASDIVLRCRLWLRGDLWRKTDGRLQASPRDVANFSTLNRRESIFPGS